MKKIMEKIIEGRIKELLALIREGRRTDLIERGLALLAIDIIVALKRERGAARVGCNCFREIDFAITGTLKKKLSGDAHDLINEMIILDEFGKRHGPNLALAVRVAKKILNRQDGKFLREARRAATVVAA